MLMLPLDAWQQIWVPDTFMRHSKEEKIHRITVDNRLTKLNATTGSIFYVLKVTAKLACPMDFRSFPMDRQNCPMIFESFKYTWNQMSLRPMAQSVEVNPGLQLQNHVLIETATDDCTQSYSSGKYPCLEIGFHFQRKIGYYILQTYMPSILVLVLSWIQFWMKAKDVQCRVLVGFLSLVSLLMINHQAADHSPEASYMTALDLWIGVCFFFIFSSLIELVIVINTDRSSSEAENKVSDGTTGKASSKILKVIWSQEGVNKIDRLSRLIFPALFILFIVIYWGIYAF